MARRRFAFGLLTLIALSTVLPAQSSNVSPAPDPAVKDVLANGRVSVRDVTWKYGAPRATNHFQESITVFLQGGRLKIVKPDGTFTVVTRQTGTVVSEAKGDPDTREAMDAPVRGIVIDLHDNVVPGITNTSGYPEAFPRPGARRVLETARVLVWDSTIAEGQPSPMHFHSRDVVAIYTENGTLASTTPQGERTVNEHTAGEVRFNPRSRVHTEQLVRGKIHLIAVELK